MDALVRRNDRVPLAILFLAILFLIKSLYLAFYVTPLWDIPDESGHLAYVIQIASGQGIPVIGSAVIPSDITSHIFQVENSPPQSNWIAQHPPLYYYLAAIPFWLAQQITTDIDIIFRAPRIVAAICGSLALIVLYRTFRLLGLGKHMALCLSGCAGWTPMFSHLASGTNHDVPLFFIAALAVYFFVRFVCFNDIRDIYISSIFIGLAGLTKMTAWVLIPPFVLFVALELRGDIRSWFKHLFFVGFAALFFPLCWMLRNVLEYGNPIYTAGNIAVWLLDSPMESSLLDFLQTQPVFEHFLRNYYGLIGWIGSGAGQQRWFQLDGFPIDVFSLSLFIIAGLLVYQFCVVVYRAGGFVDLSRVAGRMIGNPLRNIARLKCLQNLVLMLGATSFAVLICLFAGRGVFMNMRLIALFLVVSVGFTAPIIMLMSERNGDRLFLYGVGIFVFFALVLLGQIFEAYLLDGRMRATHGRYFYPVLPWLCVSVAIAMRERARIGYIVTLIFPALILAHADSYLNQILPFYSRGVL